MTTKQLKYITSIEAHFTVSTQFFDSFLYVWKNFWFWVITDENYFFEYTEKTDFLYMLQRLLNVPLQTNLLPEIVAIRTKQKYSKLNSCETSGFFVLLRIKNNDIAAHTVTSEFYEHKTYNVVDKTSCKRVFRLDRFHYGAVNVILRREQSSAR